MRRHARHVQGHRQAAPLPMDPALIASQVFENARPYEASCVDSATPLDYPSLLAQQPFAGCCASIGPVHSIPFTFFTLDPVGQPAWPIRPHQPSPGIHRGSVPSVRHEDDFHRQSGPVNPSSAPQPQAGRHSREGNRKSEPSPLQNAEADPRGQLSVNCNYTPSSGPVTSASCNFPISFTAPTSFRDPPREASPYSRLQVSQGGSPSSFKDHKYLWIEHGQRDPSTRSLHARTLEDNDRIDAIHQKGGACGPCGHSRKQCDALDHCRRCVAREIPSEAAFLASIPPGSYTPGLEKLSLYPLHSTTPPNTGLPADLDLTRMIDAQKQAANHVNSWFKHVTRKINPEPFNTYIFEREVSLNVASGINSERSTCFNLEYLDISSHLEGTAYQLDEESLLIGLGCQSSASRPAVLKNGQLRSRSLNHLSSLVSHTFAFLRSFANADMHAAIDSMSAARATVSIIYASLYRLLLAKSDDLCSFVLRSCQQDFKYCARRSRIKVVQDSLRALAQYHLVVAGLAGLELGPSCEASALLAGLQERARNLLCQGGIRELFLRIHAKSMTTRGPPRALGRTAPPTFEELIRTYSSEVPGIKSPRIALRINSRNPNLAPISTQAMRDYDPWRHYWPIKVRDLLKKGKDLDTDPKQVYVNDLLGNFDGLGHTLPAEPDSGPSSSAVQKLLSDLDPSGIEPLSTSLHPEHASINASQQDTETDSIESDLTVQNETVLGYAQRIATPAKGQAMEHGWRDVPPGKGCKRRERSGDSQGSHRVSGDGDRKHIKLDAGRDSPDPHNYFDPLAEPAMLP